MTRPLPSNTQAERALLGAVLVRPSVLAEVRGDLAAGDFSSPVNGHVWDALCRLQARGEEVEVVGVADELRRLGLLDACGGEAALVELQASTPSFAVRRFARLIGECATLRRLVGVAGEIAELGYGEGDAGDAVDQARALVAGIDVPSAGVPDDLHVLDDFLGRPKPAGGRRWLVPGLLRPGWRVVIVAPEGVGKSFVLRAFAIGAASGVHPFGVPGVFEPVRTLLVDLENPPDAIDESCEPITAQARRLGDYEPQRMHLWHRPGGIDIRRRADRAAFEAVLSHARPDVVCLGPLYKVFHRTKGEDSEIAAEEVQQILDDLRTRFSFALVMEHHAPKGMGAAHRELAPFGSQRWMAWPELGVTLAPENVKDPSVLAVARFRYDRVKAAWPRKLERGVTWPWVGTWDEGMPHVPAREAS